jgi:hypothetical protein
MYGCYGGLAFFMSPVVGRLSDAVGLGLGRALSLCSTIEARLPDSPAVSVALFLKQERDRTLGRPPAAAYIGRVGHCVAEHRALPACADMGTVRAGPPSYQAPTPNHVKTGLRQAVALTHCVDETGRSETRSQDWL